MFKNLEDGKQNPNVGDSINKILSFLEGYVRH